MMNIDQNTNTQPQQNNTSSSHQAQQQQGNQKVSEGEASKFSDQLKKTDKSKKNKNKNENKDETIDEQSLSSILAEQSKHTKSLLALTNKEGREGMRQLLDDELEQALQDQLKDGNSLYNEEHKGAHNIDHQRLRESMLDASFISIQDNQLRAEMQIKEVQQVKSIKDVEAALQKMADQIQVSAKGAINGAEIKIAIKDNILPATEVRIHRHGGELTITMSTGSSDTHNFLAQHVASLQKQLDERFSSESVQINLDMAGDMNDQGDGGSRNEYVEDETIDINKKNKNV